MWSGKGGKAKEEECVDPFVVTDCPPPQDGKNKSDTKSVGGGGAGAGAAAAGGYGADKKSQNDELKTQAGDDKKFLEECCQDWQRYLIYIIPLALYIPWAVRMFKCPAKCCPPKCCCPPQKPSATPFAHDACPPKTERAGPRCQRECQITECKDLPDEQCENPPVRKKDC